MVSCFSVMWEAVIFFEKGLTLRYRVSLGHLVCVMIIACDMMYVTVTKDSCLMSPLDKIES